MDRLEMQGAMAVIKRAQAAAELSVSQSKGLELSGSADGFSNDLLAAIRSVIVVGLAIVMMTPNI